MRDPTTRFSDRVADYVRFRPGYPAGLLDALAEATGFDAGWVVADVGSGTGISARLFLDHGNRVYAVEPNPEMRAAAEARLDGRKGFASVAGSAEATGLPAGSVDLVVAAQAFHWFDRTRTRREWGRVLRPPRWVALVWNRRLPDADDFARGYEALLRRYGTDYAVVGGRDVTVRELEEFFQGRIQERTLPNEQRFDLEGLRGRLLSSSYAPAAGHPDHAPMLDALRSLFDRHQEGGRVRFVYDTQLFVGRLGGPGGDHG